MSRTASAGINNLDTNEASTRESTIYSKLKSPSPPPYIKAPSETAVSIAHSKAGSSIHSEQTSPYPKKGTTLGQIELTYEEQAHLENVLARVDEFRQADERRISKLQRQLVEIQTNRLKKGEANTDGRCYDCKRLFMPFFNKPINCSQCHTEYCRLCLKRVPKSDRLLCKFCYAEIDSRVKLNAWYFERLKEARAQRRIRGVSGPEALRKSIIRIKRETQSALGLSGYPGRVPPYTGGKAFSALEPSTTLSDSGYGQPRTEAWVEKARNAALQDQYIADKPPPKPSPAPRPMKPARLPVPADSRNGSDLDDDTSSLLQPPKHGSVSDLQIPGAGKIHRARLGSVGSRSTLSLASGTSQGSMLSLYSEREASYAHGIAITGELQLAVLFDESNSKLRVVIKQARQLAVADQKRQTTDAYVKIYLLPDKTKASKRKTSMKKSSLSPVFDEELTYTISSSEINSRSLQVSVWHYKAVGVNLFLGEVIIPLSNYKSAKSVKWYPLSERRRIALPTDMVIYRGELKVALKYVTVNLSQPKSSTRPGSGELQVWIKSAQNLMISGSGNVRASRRNPTVDAYVKLYLLPERLPESKRKTKTMKHNNNPNWNMVLTYSDIHHDDLSQMGVELSVWDHERLSTNDFLGGNRLNTGAGSKDWMDASRTEQSIWLAMIERPDTWIEGTLRLRPNLD